MKRANRAAQFAPFDSLKGLQQALREKEEKMNCIPQKELTEEKQEEISAVLIQLEKNMTVEVIYYLDGHYLTLEGKVRDINLPYKFMLINNTKIHFSNLYKITICL